MEALLFLINCLVIVTIVFQGLIDDRRAAGAPAKSFFRTRDPDGSEEPVEAETEPDLYYPDPWEDRTP